MLLLESATGKAVWMEWAMSAFTLHCSETLGVNQPLSSVTPHQHSPGGVIDQRYIHLPLCMVAFAGMCLWLHKAKWFLWELISNMTLISHPCNMKRTCFLLTEHKGQAERGGKNSHRLRNASAAQRQNQTDRECYFSSVCTRVCVRARPWSVGGVKSQTSNIQRSINLKGSSPLPACVQHEGNLPALIMDGKARPVLWIITCFPLSLHLCCLSAVHALRAVCACVLSTTHECDCV